MIPGHHQVSLDWLPLHAGIDPGDLRYLVAVKLRTASWEDARITTVPGDQTSVTATGLLNQADYTVRVIAQRVRSSQPLGMSLERLVRPGAIPGVVIDYLHKDDPVYAGKGQYIGSPSLARLEDGRLVASHDLFGPGSSDHTRIFRSADGGQTWRFLAGVEPAFWGKLFVHRRPLYLLACRREYGDLLLHHSPNGGETWEEPVVLAAGPYHQAPVPVITHRGRLWTCSELQTGGWPAGFQAVTLSVPVDADLQNPENWTVSEPLPCDPAWLPEGWEVPRERYGFLEGNAVVDLQGNLRNVLRYHIAPYCGKVVVLNVAPDGTSQSFQRVMDFPGGMTKFTLRRHPETGVYWSLVNRVTDPQQPGMRSVLTLVCSPDGDHWTLVRDLLRDDHEMAPRYTGFQYVDWLFDGNDLLAVCRMACNGAANFHDANHLTFHRIPDFATGPRMVGP